MTRLYEAAKVLRGISGQSEVARALNASPQKINNWEARGMSKAGMLEAQAIFGCSATWLETGEGTMELYGSRESELAGALSLSAQTAREAQLLQIYRLTTDEGRALIDVAINHARRLLRDR